MVLIRIEFNWKPVEFILKALLLNVNLRKVVRSDSLKNVDSLSVGCEWAAERHCKIPSGGDILFSCGFIILHDVDARSSVSWSTCRIVSKYKFIFHQFAALRRYISNFALYLRGRTDKFIFEGHPQSILWWRLT